MPRSSSAGVDALGQQRLGAGEGEQAAGQGGGAGRAFHRIVEVELAPRGAGRQPRRARSMPPTTTASILLKSWAMPPVSWPTASIFWTWRSCASAASRSSASAFSAWLASHSSWVRSAPPARALGALGLALGLAARGEMLAKRLDRDDAEEDRAEADQDREPAQIIGEAGPPRPTRLRSAPCAGGERCARLRGDLRRAWRAAPCRSRSGGLVEVADAALPSLGGRAGPRARARRRAVSVQALELGDAALLLRIVADQRSRAGRSGSPASASRCNRRVPVSWRPRRARSGRARPRHGDAGVDRRADEHHVIGWRSGLQRAFAGVVGHRRP